MERRLNKAGKFILCFVRDLEAKKYSIVFPEGKGQASGWNSLAKRLWSGPVRRFKGYQCAKGFVEVEGSGDEVICRCCYDDPAKGR